MDAIRGEFRTVTVACAPRAAAFTPQEWARAEAVVRDALAQRPAGVRRQVVLFVRVLDALSFLRFGKGLARLDPVRARRLLGSLERSPLLLLRRGTWGLRTLAFMGVYGQAGVRREIGYGATLRGWEARGGPMGPWPERAGAAPAEHPDA